MCTVSFIQRKEGCFITSNRDEHLSRPSALKPEETLINGVKVLYPKDPQAGGTWFAINEFGAVSVLLNGAFKNHVRELPYAKSRGLVLLETISSINPYDTLLKMDLNKIEPFTLVLFDGQNLQEFRWDGTKGHAKQLDATHDHIWSSVTLYDTHAIEKRNTLFREFIGTNTELTAQKIVDFHTNNHMDYENGFIIDRSNGLKTFSVTQAIIQPGKSQMNHFDLLSNTKYHEPLIHKPLASLK